MLRFGLKISVFVALVLVGIPLIGVLTFDNESDTSSYLSAIIDKHNRLESVNAPRIIFVGGSSLAFGLDSQQVERALHFPVVNMGLHAAVGMRFMLNEVQDKLAPGDIVVISPEYEQFYGYLEGKEVLLDTLVVYPQAVRYLTSPQQVLSLLEGLPVAIQQMVRARLYQIVFGKGGSNAFSVYRRSGFNAEGDMTGHLNQPSQDVSKLANGLGTAPDDNAFIALGQFARLAQSKGARVFFLFPAIPQSRYVKVADQLPKVCQALKTIPELTVLAAPRDYVFADNSFFDTVYHLNRVARDQRTQMVIADLKRGLETLPQINCRAAME